MRKQAILIALAVPGSLSAQVGGQPSDTADEAYVPQAQPSGPMKPSAVYWPESMTPESVKAARTAAAAQLSRKDDTRPVVQLTPISESSDPLAQLSEIERQVLLDAIEGTDICDRETQIAAIRELCARRLETRSEDFASRRVNQLSPEERLLGESLAGRSATLERAIERLARSGAQAENFEDQAIASVALNAGGLPAEQSLPAKTNPAGQLSAETQALINAIVEQFRGASGGG